MKIKEMVCLSVITAVILIFSSCAVDGSEDGFISGAKKRSLKEKEMMSNIASTIYTVPEMDQVKVRVDDHYAPDKYMDLYYPPNFDFEQKLPAVIIFNGFGGIGAKNMGRSVDWAALVAAHGMIGITYEPIYPDQDFELLLADLIERADELSINSKNMGLICYCGTCPDGLKAFVGNSKVYSHNLATGVFMYGSMPWDNRIRKDSSMLLVKTGKGLDDYVKKSIDRFYQTAADQGMDVKMINYENGFKYFDVTETGRSSWEYGASKTFVEDCNVMKEILAWLQNQMFTEAGR